MAAYNSNTQYSRKLDNFRGVDFSSGQTQVSPQRFAYAQNMWRDYSSELGGAIETVPGFRLLNRLEGRIHGIWQYRPTGGELYVMVHAGTALYRFAHADRNAAAPINCGSLADAKSTAFVFDGRFYILDGESYRVLYVEDGEFVFEDATGEAYLPVTFMNGEMYEQRNMLLDKTINRETQPPEYDASELYRYSKHNLNYNSYYSHIEGFRKNVKSDVVIAIGELNGQSDDGSETYGVAEKISDRAFAGNTDIKRVYIGSVGMGKSAFEDCTSLIRADVSSGMNERCFAGCTALKEINLFAVGVPKQSFSGCSSLETIKLTKVNSMDRTAFENCDSIKTIYLGELDSDFWSAGYKEVVENVEDENGDMVPTITGYRGVWTQLFGTGENITDVYTELSEEEWEGKIKVDLPDDTTAVGTLKDLFPEEVTIHYETSTPIPDAYIDRTPDETGDKRTYLEDARVRYATVFDPADSVDEVTVDEEKTEEYSIVYHVDDEETYVDKLLFIESATTDDPLTDKEIDIVLNCKPSEFTTAEGYVNFADGNTDYKGTSKDAIIKSRLSATYDGRVFVSGNPALPNTVFYTARDNTGHTNPTYFGIVNYFNDGTGSSENVALLPTANMLMVLKGRDPHDATVYYHVGTDTGNDVVPRVYPSERGVAGEGCVGVAVNFRDDAVFLSKSGLEAVGKQQVNLERTLAHRSSLVDRMLAAEDLTKAVAAEWEGYLVIFTPSGGTYLADSRQMHQGDRGVLEYEWYYMNDIGVYADQTEDYEQATGDLRLYEENGTPHWLTDEDIEAYVVVDRQRYKLSMPPAVPEYIENGRVWQSSIYSAASGNEVWYSDENKTAVKYTVALFDGEAYIVNPSGRYSGGTFNCVTAAENVDGVLYFGTEHGAICCFNTDKRGEGYGEEPGVPGRIHRHWYTFNNRQIDSFVTTAYDGAGYPDLAKKTVKKSLVVHTKSIPGSRVEVRVRTNRNDTWRDVAVMGGAWRSLDTISAATYDFYSTDYASAPLQLADETLTTVREKEKKWALKQLYLGSVGFRAPWGLYHIGYRFTITGRIKS
jgi:hypothetical protein